MLFALRKFKEEDIVSSFGKRDTVKLSREERAICLTAESEELRRRKLLTKREMTTELLIERKPPPPREDDEYKKASEADGGRYRSCL
jgi:hypothetical protein